MDEGFKVKKRFGLVMAAFLALTGIVAPTTVAAQSVDRSAISEWERQDDPNDCDEIGWAITSTSDLMGFESETCRFIATRGAAGYLAICGTTEGDSFFSPSPSELWIVCIVRVGNTGSSTTDVSMFDFSLVTSTGRKLDSDITPLFSTGGDGMFPTQTLREGQFAEGLISFVVPASEKLPYTIEIDPLLEFTLRSTDPSIIVIDSLESIDNIGPGF